MPTFPHSHPPESASITIVVVALDSILSQFDVIKVYRSTSVNSSGPFVEITTPTTRIPLVEGQATYIFTDDVGFGQHFYRVSYFNTTTSAESLSSEPQQGEEDSALGVISVAELKTNYLFGLDLTDDAGTPYPDSLFEFYIKSAVSWMEHRLDIPIRPRVITEEPQDFLRQEYYKYMFTKTDESPVISVERVRLVLPTGQEVHVFDHTWIHLAKESGQINIVPGAGATSIPLLGAAGIWVPIFRGWGDGDYIPDVFRLDYTAGFDKGAVPPVITDLIGKVASYGPLNLAGDLIIGAGIANISLSLDGLSQSIGTTSSAENAGYSARLIRYTKEVKEQVPVLRNYYHGIGFYAA